ncbi:MAG: hypothetical protein ABR978_02320 [Dehalococcoidia bacterium]|jgi:hypothetical protein
MTVARAVRPTDLVALVAFDGRVYPNEAKTRERMGKADAAPHPLERALEQWFSFATGCRTWISVKGATLRGLVSARRRGSARAWELDCLINAAEDDGAVCVGLLDEALRDATRSGVEKVFLRLAAGSTILPLARKIGFTEYVREQLFSSLAPTIVPADGDADPPLRKMQRADELSLFHLYNAAVPEPVRRAEAVTFIEWKAAQDRHWLGRGASQLVVERDKRVTAWLRAAVQSEVGRFDLLAHPGEPSGEALLNLVVERLSGRSQVLTLVPKYATNLATNLLQRGFQEGPEYCVLAKRTAVTVKAHQLAHAI